MDFYEYKEWFISDALKGWKFTEEDINRKRYRHSLEPDVLYKRIKM